MAGLVFFQIVALSLLLIITISLGYPQKVWFSQLFGGLTYLIPTLLTVSFLKILKPYPRLAGVGFFISVGLKIISALIMMLVIFVLYKELQFLPYFVGLLISSHLVFLLFLRVHRYGK